MKFLLPLLLCLSASAADWQAHYFGSRNTITNVNDGLARLPVYVMSQSYLLRCVTTTNEPKLLGDLRGATITLTAHTVVSGNPQYAWLGCTTYNTGPMPLHVRIFISADPTTYNVAYGVQNETVYWWSSAYAAWSNQVLTVTAVVEPSQWSDANGHVGNYSPEITSGFWTTMGNVKQIGVMFCGGHFYDVGGAVKNNTGSAWLQLDSMTVEQCVRRDVLWPVNSQ